MNSRAYLMAVTLAVASISSACGGSDTGLGVEIYTNGITAATFDVVVQGGSGVGCPATIDATSAGQMLSLPLCVGAPASNCAARKAAVGAGQDATLKDIPTGNVVVFVSAPQGGPPTSGGCTTAAISAGQYATASVTLNSF